MRGRQAVLASLAVPASRGRICAPAACAGVEGQEIPKALGSRLESMCSLQNSSEQRLHGRAHVTGRLLVPPCAEDTRVPTSAQRLRDFAPAVIVVLGCRLHRQRPSTSFAITGDTQTPRQTAVPSKRCAALGFPRRLRMDEAAHFPAPPSLATPSLDPSGGVA